MASISAEMLAIYRNSLWTCVVSALLCACAEPRAAESPASPPSLDGPAVSTDTATEPPGRGFVVWESNRTGAWRIWLRELDGSPPRQLSPDEGDRQHCCPHVTPGGEHVAYLSLPRGQARYPESGASGPMHLIGIDGEGDRVIAGEARTYFEHRAVVWRDARELIFIDGDGRTRLLDTSSGESRLLTEQGEARHGWLVNGRLSHATTGRPSFSTYDEAGLRVEPGRELGGCQPYFSHDGRWGFWVAGAGGPIRALELEGRRTVELLAKSDMRLPPGQGYLYFPMLSHDSTLLAVAASADEHDHATSNYDVFVTAVDPDNLEVLGDAWRVSSDPAVDRFPDVYAEPLALGRHFGEAPLAVTFSVPEGGDWQWRLDGVDAGDGSARFEHVFEQAGSYRVEARREGGDPLLGVVRARPARPPEVTGVTVRRGREIVVRFDEEVDLAAVSAELDSTMAVERVEPGADGSSLIVETAEELRDFEILRLDGVRDRAQRPNSMPAIELEVPPPSWPASRRGLVFLWQSGDALNEIERPEGGVPRTCRLEPQGRAWFDRHYAMELAGGLFFADKDSVLAILEGCRKTYELTLEATLTPRAGLEGAEDVARIVSFSSGLGSRNLTLGQRGDRLVLRLRTGTTGRNADRPQLELGRVEPDRPVHVLVTYTPGRLTAWLDGEKTVESDAIQQGFFHWQPLPFVFGNEWKADRPWHGTLEAIAVYNRALGEDEVLESHRRAMERIARRPPAASVSLRATLVERSKTPSLDEIAPYREALAVYEYRVDEVLSGDYTEPFIRVAHRVLADGEALPVSRRATSRVYRLEVESFFDHPQLESLYLANDLPPRKGVPLYFSSAIE